MFFRIVCQTVVILANRLVQCTFLFHPQWCSIQCRSCRRDLETSGAVPDLLVGRRVIVSNSTTTSLFFLDILSINHRHNLTIIPILGTSTTPFQTSTGPYMRRGQLVGTFALKGLSRFKSQQCMDHAPHYINQHHFISTRYPVCVDTRRYPRGIQPSFYTIANKPIMAVYQRRFSIGSRSLHCFVEY